MTNYASPGNMISPPRRAPFVPRPALADGADARTVINASPPSVTAHRLTAKELNEPLGRSPIRNAGAARFGIMPLDTAQLTPRTAGRASARSESVASLISSQGQPLPPLSSSPLSGRTPRGDNNNNNTNTSQSSSPMSTGRVRDGISPRVAAHEAAHRTTFTALPGGPESASHFRFGAVVKSETTARDVISPRAGSDGAAPTVVPSPDRQRSNRFGHGHNGSQPRADPAALPAACLPTAEGVKVGAALPSLKAHDSVASIIASTGMKQQNNKLFHTTGEKVNARPPASIEESRAGIAYGLASARDGASPTNRRLLDARHFKDEPGASALVNDADRTSVSAMLTDKTLTCPEDAAVWSERCMFGLSPREVATAFQVAQEAAGSMRVSLQDFKEAVNALY